MEVFLKNDSSVNLPGLALGIDKGNASEYWCSIGGVSCSYGHYLGFYAIIAKYSWRKSNLIAYVLSFSIFNRLILDFFARMFIFLSLMMDFKRLKLTQFAEIFIAYLLRLIIVLMINL